MFVFFFCTALRFEHLSKVDIAYIFIIIIIIIIGQQMAENWGGGGGGANHQVIRHCLTLWKFDFKNYRTLMSELYNDVEMDK